jgi:hypothetical protein
MHRAETELHTRVGGRHERSIVNVHYSTKRLLEEIFPPSSIRIAHTFCYSRVAEHRPRLDTHASAVPIAHAPQTIADDIQLRTPFRSQCRSADSCCSIRRIRKSLCAVFRRCNQFVNSATSIEFERKKLDGRDSTHPFCRQRAKDTPEAWGKTCEQTGADESSTERRTSPPQIVQR